MAGKFTVNETINTLKAIFEKHKNERICVIGTICCGKTTLLKQIPDCIDVDDELLPQLTEEEAAFINQTPWTEAIGNEVDRLIYEKIKIKPGFPLFTSVILDCEAVVYLDISNELLAGHCKKRGVSLSDALNIKEAIENDWNDHKEKDDKAFYYVTIVE